MIQKNRNSTKAARHLKKKAKTSVREDQHAHAVGVDQHDLAEPEHHADGRPCRREIHREVALNGRQLVVVEEPLDDGSLFRWLLFEPSSRPVPADAAEVSQNSSGKKKRRSKAYYLDTEQPVQSVVRFWPQPSNKLSGHQRVVTKPLVDSSYLAMHYHHVMLAALAWRPVGSPATRGLLLGLGGGALPAFLLEHYPELHLHAVEQDPLVHRVARRFFGLPWGTHMTVHTAEARSFLDSSRAAAFDAIFVDVDAPDPNDALQAPPAQLCTFEACISMHRMLRPGGVVAINVMCTEETMRQQILHTFARVFREFEVLSTEDINLVVVGIKRVQGGWGLNSTTQTPSSDQHTQDHGKFREACQLVCTAPQSKAGLCTIAPLADVHLLKDQAVPSSSSSSSSGGGCNDP